MVANILVAHGMRKGNQNEALTEFVDELLKNEDYHYALAFIESEEKSIEKTVEDLIEKGENQFKIVPLLIFSAMHYLIDVPEILKNLKIKYPNIDYYISQPLGTHDLMQNIITKRIDDVEIPQQHNYAIMPIAHGSFSYTQAHGELNDFCKQLNYNVNIYPRTLYGDITFRNDLDQLSREYDDLIVVPMFLYDGRLVNKVKRLIGEMDIKCKLHITPSLNFDPTLKEIIRQRLDELENQLNQVRL